MEGWRTEPSLERRDPWLHGILTAVTLGFWAYYWCYVTVRDGREHRGQRHQAGLLTGLSVGFLVAGMVLAILLFLPLMLAGLAAAIGFGGGRDPVQVMEEMLAAGAAAVAMVVLGAFLVGALYLAGTVLRYVLLYQAADVVAAIGEDAGRKRPLPAFAYPLGVFGVGLLGIPFLPSLAWGGSVLHLQMEWNKTLEAPLPERPEAAGA